MRTLCETLSLASVFAVPAATFVLTLLTLSSVRRASLVPAAAAA